MLAKQKLPVAVGLLQVLGIGSQLCCASELDFVPHTSCWECWKYFWAHLSKCILCFCPRQPAAQPGHVCGVGKEALHPFLKDAGSERGLGQQGGRHLAKDKNMY